MLRNLDHTEGFTLLELMIVIFILMILVFMAVPMFSRLGDSLRFETNESDLVGLMNFAHGHAVMEGRRYAIQMDSLSKTYRLVREDQDGLNENFIRVPDKWGQTRRLAAKTECRSTDDLVIFYPDGTATPLTLDLSSPGRFAMTLQVDPVLGKAFVTVHG